MPPTTDQYQGMIAETVSMTGANGDAIDAYLARPLGPGPFPAVVLLALGTQTIFASFFISILFIDPN